MNREMPSAEQPPREEGGENIPNQPENEGEIYISGFEIKESKFPDELEFMGHSFKLLGNQLRTNEAVYDRQGEGGEIEGIPQIITVNTEGRIISKTY